MCLNPILEFTFYAHSSKIMAVNPYRILRLFIINKCNLKLLRYRRDTEQLLL